MEEKRDFIHAANGICPDTRSTKAVDASIDELKQQIRELEHALQLNEKELLENKNHLDKIQKLAHIGSWIWDIKNNIQVWSDERYRIFGMTPGEREPTYEVVMSLIHPDDRGSVEEALKAAVLGSRPFDLEYRIVRKDGSIRFLYGLGDINFNESGEPVVMHGISQDITVDKQVKKELKKLSWAVEQSPAAVVITTLNGKIEYVNPKFTQLTGYSSEEVIGQNYIVSFGPGKNLQTFFMKLWNTILTGKVWRGEFSTKNKNGELFWESVVISPVKNDSGIITHFMAIMEDVTERRQMEEALLATKNFLAEIFNESPDAIITMDQHCNILSVNKRTAELFKYDMEEFTGMNLKSLLPDSEEIVLTGKRSFIRDFMRKDRIRISLNITISRFAYGEVPNGFIITLKDLSEITGFNIIPITEAASDKSQEYHLEKGVIYFFDKSKGSNHMDVFSDQVRHSVSGLCITRQNPSRIRAKYGLTKTPIIWLNGSDATTGETCIKPDNLAGLSSIIYKFMTEAKNGFIMLDGIEYLITRNSFESVLKFINTINDRVMTLNGRMLFCIDSRALEIRQYRTIISEMQEFEEYKNR